MILWFLFLANSPILITEVMSNVKGPESGIGAPGDRNEFVEIYNESGDTIDLANYFINDFDAEDRICPWEDEAILVKYPTLRIHSTLIYPCSYAVILDSEYISTDTIGGYVQPYDFPDSILILSTDDTSIGGTNLTTTDPIIIYSEADACTTSFGTPYDTLDNFPYDPGDGISLERIDLMLPDLALNWYPSLDSSGCTPGQENSATNDYDLAVEVPSIIFTPASLESDEDLQIEIRIKNIGLRSTDDYRLIIFDDINADSTNDGNEQIADIAGLFVATSDSASLYHTYENPEPGTHHLGFQIDCALDRNPQNNLVFKDLVVFQDVSELMLSPDIFTPNGDGIDDRLQIDYRLPTLGGKLLVKAFDTRGKSVYEICEISDCDNVNGTLYWDGTSSRGKAQTGTYIIYLEYQSGNNITKAKKTTVLAR